MSDGQSFQSITETLKNIQEENNANKKQDPQPSDPAPTEPTPVDTTLSEPTPTDPTPVEPTPTALDFSVIGEEYKGKTPEQIKEEINNYKARVQALENNTVDIDPDLYRLNILKVKDEGNFNLYKNLLFGEVTTIELLKLKSLTENPLLKDEPDVDEIIKEKYGLDIEIPEQKTPEDFLKDDGDLDDAAYRQYNKSIDKAKKKLRVAELNAKNEAENFRKSKLDEFKKTEVPFLSKETRQQNLQKLDENWRPVTDSIMDTYLKDKFKITFGKDESKVDVELPIDKEQREVFKKELQNFFINNDLPLTKESYQQGVQYVHTLYKMNNFDSIIEAYAEKRVKDKEEEWRNKGINPSYKQNAAANTNIKTDNNDQFYEKMFKKSGLGG